MKPRHPEKIENAKQALKDNPTMSIVEVASAVGLSPRTLYRHVGPQGYRKPRKTGFRKSKEEVAAILQRWAGDHGRVPMAADFFHSQDGIGHMTVYRQFGNWDKALEYAGLEPINWRKVGLPAKMKLTHADLKAKDII